MTAPIPIGAAVLDPAAATLAGPGGTAPLPPQAVALLAHLAAHAGRVVPKLDATDAMYGDRLPARGTGWPTMQARVHLLRRALRNVGAGAEIATLPGVGIRLDVPGAAPRDAAPAWPRPRAPTRPDALRSREAALAAMLADRELCGRVRRMRAAERRSFDYIAAREGLTADLARMLGGALGLPRERLDRGARA